MLQEITYIEADKLRAVGLTEAELNHIADVTDKHIASMVRHLNLRTLLTSAHNVTT